MGKLREKIVILKLQNKNTEAFAKVYDAYMEKIYRFIFFKISNKQEAEDMTSEVFLKAWEYILEGKDIISLRSFLYAVARNKVIDLYRKRGKNNIINLVEIEQIKDNSADPNKLIDNEMNRKNIFAFLDKLKSEYKEVLLLRYVEDFSISEISEILGKNKGNIRVLVHRALEALREVMEAEK